MSDNQRFTITALIVISSFALASFACFQWAGYETAKLDYICVQE